ncbi:MAG: hypothetical protein JNK16_11685 [Phycisphaerales bacterium]|nr:hypothetical protein [Phycisphaerales bacterium]
MSQEEMESRRLALIAEVYAAFKGVTREGGVSWRQSRLHDAGVRPYTPREYREAGEKDKDTGWEELVDDANWEPETGGAIGGSFSFLDAFGFRYYVPIVLVRELRDWGSCCLTPWFHLNCPPTNDGQQELRIRQFSALNERQKQCIAAFIRYAIDRAVAEKDGGLAFEGYAQAWIHYWKQFAGDVANDECDADLFEDDGSHDSRS